MGSQTFFDVTIPLLWGNRAVVQDSTNRLSVINLVGYNARVEVLADKPSAGTSFTLVIGGFAVLDEFRKELYVYMPAEKRLTATSLKLPECQILPDRIAVGGLTMSRNTIANSPVGIIVTESGIGIGGPMPPGLARLRVDASLAFSRFHAV
jgi:hypothetical protein